MCFRVERDGLLFPMNEVRTDGMAPVHVAPFPAVGIVLIEEVVLAIVIDETVGVIDPAALCAEMKLWA